MPTGQRATSTFTAHSCEVHIFRGHYALYSIQDLGPDVYVHCVSIRKSDDRVEIFMYLH